MGAPSKPRAKRVPQPCSYKGEEHHLSQMWSDPETRKKMLAISKKGAKTAGRIAGTPDGYSNKDMNKLRPQIDAEAEEIMKHMEKDGLLDPVVVVEDDLLSNDAMIAREALKAAIVIMRTPGAVAVRLKAAETLLSYTKVKPASTVNQKIDAAEDFLAALVRMS